LIVDSYLFLPRSFRPFYEGRGPFRGEEEPVWSPFPKRLAESRIALLSSAGLYLKGNQQSFDLDGERARPDWGDPSWRAIPATVPPEQVGFAHLHISHDDLLADPEIALPARALAELVDQGVAGGATAGHVAVMGYQARHLRDWKEKTSVEIVSFLREQDADGLVLAPA